jgi:hypothetical protein
MITATPKAHKLAVEPDVSDVRDPYLVRSHDLQLLHQVGIPWKRVIAIGRSAASALDFALEVHLLHQTAHSFAVDDPSLTTQLRRNPTITIGGPLASHIFDGSFDFCLVWLLGLVVIATPGTAHQVAKERDRIVLGKHPDHLPFLVEREVKMLEAFFAASSSMVKRPTIRSSSPIRSCSSPRLGLVANISGARSKNSTFQREKTWGLIRCFRQISAVHLRPVSSSRTIWALNSGLNVRRIVVMVVSPFMDYYIELSQLSNLWGSLLLL